MIIGTKFNGYSRDGVRRLYMGGGGGGSTQSTSTSYQTNIPEYARPYTETMLGATQRQLFEGNQQAATVNPLTGESTPGNFEITGFKPYQPYSTSPGDYVAGFSPMQQQAQQTVAGMQVPGQYQAAADITGAGIMGAADIGAQARAFNPMAQQAAGMGQQYQRMATDPNAISAYMSPYMQNVVDTQQREAIRQSDIQKTANMGQATQQGAFGGGRQAIIEAERQRNLGTQLGSIQAQGSQNAFQQAQQAQQYGANLGLQGLQTGAGIYGQGLTAQQQAIQQALGGAGQLAGLGGQALEAQKGIVGLQGQMGAQQQSMEQQKINQAIQDYANAQQYPLMQLGTMSNMLRGLPMQAQTTNQYVAAPNPITQGIGMAGAGASLYNAFNPTAGRAPGMAEGGIASVPQYDVGGEVESDLESMPTEALAREAKESPSPTIRQKAQRILRERQMEQSAAPQGIQYQAPQGMAGGGIIAFREGAVMDEAAAARAQQKRDQAALAKGVSEGREGFTDVLGKVSAAGADILSMIPRGLAGAIDSTAIRGARALGADIDYLSPSLTPGDQASDTATPFYDRYIRRAKEAKEGAPATSSETTSASNDATKVASSTATAAPTRAPGGDSKRRASDAPAAPAARPTPAARPAAPTQAGIMAATTADMESGAAVGGVGSTMPATGIQADVERLQARAAQPLSVFSEEQEAERKRLGLDKNEGRDQERKNVMAELANAEDEAKRLKWMRAAKFFASWGSKPGNTLVAGMKALEDSIPEFITDEKEQKKAKRDAQKVLSALEEATRQEKLGNLKEATALKTEAGKQAMEMNKVYAQGQITAASDASRAASSKYSADMQFKAEQLRSEASKAERMERSATAAEAKKLELWRNSASDEANILNKIANERSSKEYMDLARAASLPESGSDMIKKQRSDAIARLEAINKEHTKRASEAEKRTNVFRQRATGDAAPAAADPLGLR